MRYEGTRRFIIQALPWVLSVLFSRNSMKRDFGKPYDQSDNKQYPLQLCPDTNGGLDICFNLLVNTQTRVQHSIHIINIADIAKERNYSGNKLG